MSSWAENPRDFDLRVLETLTKLNANPVLARNKSKLVITKGSDYTDTDPDDLLNWQSSQYVPLPFVKSAFEHNFITVDSDNFRLKVMRYCQVAFDPEVYSLMESTIGVYIPEATRDFFCTTGGCRTNLNGGEGYSYRWCRRHAVPTLALNFMNPLEYSQQTKCGKKFEYYLGASLSVAAVLQVIQMDYANVDGFISCNVAMFSQSQASSLSARECARYSWYLNPSVLQQDEGGKPMIYVGPLGGSLVGDYVDDNKFAFEMPEQGSITDYGAGTLEEGDMVLTGIDLVTI